MNVKGFRKTSLIDFPGEIASVIFTGGCNLRCRFCHNADLALDNGTDRIPSDEIFSILKKRKKIIDAVVVSGGEPLIQHHIFEFIGSLKSLEFKVKLDTNGFFPDTLAKLLDSSLLDYVAIDVKTAPSKYAGITDNNESFDAVASSISLVKSKAPDYEIRTTCVPGFADMDDFMEIRDKIGNVKNYFLQQFRNENTLDSSMSSCKPLSFDKISQLRDFVATFSDKCGIRGI